MDVPPWTRPPAAAESDQPASRASLGEDALAEELQALGLQPSAMPAVARAIELRRRHLGADHPDTIASVMLEGMLLEWQEKWAEAEPRYRTVLDSRRRTLGDETGEVEITGPDGVVTMVPLEEVSPGRFSADWTGPEMGLYRLKEGDKESVVALGPAAPKEFEETIATPAVLEPAVTATRGGVHRVADGVPDIRRSRTGRVGSGRGWIGITPREAYLTADIRISPLLPAWAMLLLAGLLAAGAWLWEGRR